MSSLPNSTLPSPLPNRFRADVLAHKRVIGCWCSLGNATTTEILGLAGFDWLLLDGEHSPNDVLTFIPQLMALQGSVSAPVVRPPANDPVLIKRLLDIGFYNFLIPFVESAEQAGRAVSATRYPPAGMRGVSSVQRSNRYGTVPEYFSQINDNICVLVQIESQKGVDAADEICAVDGVDGIFIGPNDLAAAYGHLGNPNHPEVQAQVARIFEAARRAGKAVGTLTPVEADARRYLDMGASFVAVGLDQNLFRTATQALRDRFAS
ncbi:2-dehydro-3-deoxyglucarate aldolase [Cupriavidus sp. YAF13]|uniref:2-dehydro-3-deoxyglucarate aldolase n=1 Tax=Cupriavidus sp. YAF13 TaxID=3233075 RepID=UPI003F8D9E37